MNEVILSSETSDLTRATRRNIPEDDIPQYWCVFRLQPGLVGLDYKHVTLQQFLQEFTPTDCWQFT
jgi:hypothetical protein